MTKQEFDKKFSNAYKNVLQSSEYKTLIEQKLESEASECNKISYETLATVVLSLSIKLNKEIMYSVLSEFLEPDE